MKKNRIYLYTLFVVSSISLIGCQSIGLKSDAAIALEYATEIVDSQLTSYKNDVGHYPSTDEGLQAIMVPPKGKEKNWNGPYAYEIPFDPWGNRYQYIFPGIKNPEKYDVYSLGPDGVHSDDDIHN